MKKSKLRRRVIFKSLLILFLGFMTSCDSDPFPNTILPIHPDANSITKGNNEPSKGAKFVSYYVEVEFPANELISFYVRELSSMGYKPFDVEFESRPLQKWSRFNTRSGEFDVITEPPGRYIAHWANESNNTWIWLLISSALKAPDKSDRTIVEVSCNMAKLSAYEESLRLIRKMKLEEHNKTLKHDG